MDLRPHPFLSTLPQDGEAPDTPSGAPSVQQGWGSGLTSAGHVVHAGRVEQLHRLVSARKSIWRTEKAFGFRNCSRFNGSISHSESARSPSLQTMGMHVSFSLLKETGSILICGTSEEEKTPCTTTQPAHISNRANTSFWPAGVWPSRRGFLLFNSQLIGTERFWSDRGQ